MDMLKFVIKANGRRDQDAMERAAGKLLKTDTDTMRGWMNGMPSCWISDRLRSQAIDWFDVEKVNRLHAVMEVLSEI